MIAALNGVTLPMSDPFWADYYPPNGWGCRCTVIQVRKSKYPTTDSDEAQALGEVALQSDKKGIFRFNSGQKEQTMPDYNPYTIRRCNDCDVAQGKLNLSKPLDNQTCEACRKVRQMCNEKENTDVKKKLKETINAKGAAHISGLREIVRSSIFKPVEGHAGVISAIGPSDPDYTNLLACADKVVSHGYNVAILFNPSEYRSPDFIAFNKKFIALYDVKTISGQNSAGNRLMESIGQTERVMLNLTTSYNPRLLATDIKKYFEVNKKAKEVIVYKGGSAIRVTRDQIDRRFESTFRKRYGRTK